MTSRAFTFIGGGSGPWRIERQTTIAGEPLPFGPRLDVVNRLIATPLADARWLLRGITSNERYITRAERDALRARQPPLGRRGATCAALIPIRKSAAWWELAQDERRAIFEEQSAHVSTGLRYLPAVARRLHHCRDLDEPFDFLTWFEYAPADASAFDELVAILRASEEWRYVEREIDIRVVRTSEPTE